VREKEGREVVLPGASPSLPLSPPFSPFFSARPGTLLYFLPLKKGKDRCAPDLFLFSFFYWPSVRDGEKKKPHSLFFFSLFFSLLFTRRPPGKGVIVFSFLHKVLETVVPFTYGTNGAD